MTLRRITLNLPVSGNETRARVARVSYAEAFLNLVTLRCDILCEFIDVGELEGMTPPPICSETRDQTV